MEESRRVAVLHARSPGLAADSVAAAACAASARTSNDIVHIETPNIRNVNLGYPNKSMRPFR